MSGIDQHDIPEASFYGSLCECLSGTCRSPTLTLSADQPVSLGAGAGVAPRRVDAHLGGVAVVRVGLTFIDVWSRMEVDRRGEDSASNGLLTQVIKHTTGLWKTKVKRWRRAC